MKGQSSPELPEGSESGLQILAAMGLEPHSCVYLSTPITSGPAFVRWRGQLGGALSEDDARFWIEHRRNVVAENEARFAPVEKQFRQNLGAQVVSPIHLRVPGWSQSDYHRFWAEFVRRWCRSIVLTEGWEYSTGCCIETYTARTEGIPILDEALNTVDDAAILASIRGAREDLISVRLATDPYLDVTSSLIRSIGDELPTDRPFPAKPSSKTEDSLDA